MLKKPLSKFLTLIIILCLSSTGLKAQVILSLIFGDKLNSNELLFGIHVNGSLNYFSNSEGKKPLPSLNAGLFFTYRFNDHLHANIEMLAKYTRGAKELPVYSLNDPDVDAEFTGGSVTRKNQYLSLPLSIRWLTKGGFFAEIGPQISLRTGAEDIFIKDIDEGELNLKIKTKNEMNRWDFGWLAGMGYMFGKTKLLAVGLRYNGGFSDVSKIDEGNQTNQQWGVYCNIPIGRSKMKKKQEAKAKAEINQQ